MSDQEARKDEERDATADTPPTKGKDAKSTKLGEDGKPKAEGMDYVFKIAPADPKNAFDFEDVADK